MEPRLAADDVEVVAIGPVPDEMRKAASERIVHATRLAGRPVLDARAMLRQSTNPTRVQASRVEISLSVNGAPVRARGDAETLPEALDVAANRVERLVVELVNRWNDRSRWLSVPAEGQWRRGDLPAERPDYWPRPVEEREVVRRKTFAVAPTTVEEAVYDMEALDHDFYLFTDVGSGNAAVVHRVDDGRVDDGRVDDGRVDDGSVENGYAVAGLPAGAPLPGRVSRAPAPPTLDEAAARQRLNVGGEPFVFYLDADTGKGAVLYRRYDGHYGLISTA